MGVGGLGLAAVIRSIYGSPIGAAVLSLKVGQGIDWAFWNTGIKKATQRVGSKVYYSSAFVCSLHQGMRGRAEITFEMIY